MNEYEFEIAHTIAKRPAIEAHVMVPRKGVMKKWAMLGTSGSGKTYGAGVMVEGFLDLDAQVVVIDTMGNWWGLRVDADGKRPSRYQIPVIGGDHGDIPLAPQHGEQIANTVAKTKSSMIVDISDFTEAEIKKFVIAFAKTLLAAKKRAPSPLLVVWEECQDIIPQTMYGDDAKMVGAVQRLIKRGRNYGVGTMLISQRSAAVNKGCLNQCETIFAFRSPAPLDRKAIEEWVKAVGDPERVSDLMRKVASLETGTCLMYSVAYDRCELVTIGRKRTFNASSEPDFDTDHAAKTLAPVDLSALKAELEAVLEEAQSNDVDMLKAKIADLQKQLAGVSVADNGQRLALELRFSDLQRAYNDLLYEHREFHRAADAAHLALHQVLVRPPIRALEAPGTMGVVMQNARESIERVLPVDEQADREGAAAMQKRNESAPSRKLVNGSLAPADLAFLNAVAWWHAAGVAAPTLKQVAFIAGQGPKSSAVENRRGALRVRGYIEYPDGGTIALTAKGRATARSERPTLAALHEKIRARLEPADRQLVDVLVASYPNVLSFGELARRAGQSEKSSAFENRRSKLSALGLLKYARPGHAVATSTMFPEGVR